MGGVTEKQWLSALKLERGEVGGRWCNGSKLDGSSRRGSQVEGTGTINKGTY